MKKILILVDWFAPGYKAGGPIQSCVNICAALSRQFDIYVLTTDTDHGDKIPYRGIPTGQWINDESLQVSVYYLEKKKISAKKIREQIIFINADTIYLNHLFSPLFVIYPLWLKLSGKLKNRMVVCPRGGLYESALDVKRYKKMPLLFLYRQMGIQKKVVFHATNQREQEAIQNYFPGSEVAVADNLPNTKHPPFHTINKEPGLLDCIFIARIVPIKNLLFLLNALRSAVLQVRLTIVGPDEDEAYWKQCHDKIGQLPPNISVNYLGPKPHNELNSLIQQHHLFILPTTGENFGHAIFESFLAGRPVLISDQTPWQQLQKEKAGWDLSLRDSDGFTQVIDAMAATDQEAYNEYAIGAWRYAEDYINKKLSSQQYNTLFGWAS
jgi:glycosyltransferase involved in cell wall biosynthesis